LGEFPTTQLHPTLNAQVCTVNWLFIPALMQGMLKDETTMSNLPQVEPLTVTIAVALRLSGLGRTKLYELISQKEIESVTVGSRRLIVLASLKRLLRAKGE